YSGFKTAAISGAIVAVPTLVGCRVIPWAKANLNYTAQALIISAGIIFLSTLALLVKITNHLCLYFAASVAGFFITADKTILQNARGNSIGKYDKSA
ncbi:hypothetical protein BHE74_00006685, partial [Ensete ventricosum]